MYVAPIFLKLNFNFSQISVSTFFPGLCIFLLEDSFLSGSLLLLLVASMVRNLSGKY